MADKRRSICCALFLLLNLIALLATNPAEAQSCISKSLSGIAIGFSMPLVSVESEDCNPGKSRTLPDRYIALHADDPSMMDEYAALLTRMQNEGATVMRLHLWFKHAEDGPYKDLTPANGMFPKKQLANIVAIAAKVKSLGYHRFVVVFGAQGAANPKCKMGQEFGDCYDSRFDKLTWSVTRQTIQALNPLTTADFDIVYDIAPESCPGGTNLLVDRSLAAFQRVMLNHYHAEFNDDHFIMSCGAGTAVRGIPGLQSVAALYRETNVRPSSIDVHIYEIDAGKVGQILKVASASAMAVGVPLDINETFYDDPNLFSMISSLEKSGEVKNVRQVLIFPLHYGTSCQINVPPPYDIIGINRHLGRISSDGQVLPLCINP